MLHILLMILKIAGIILLTLLGLILAILLIVLFVPIRYRVQGQKDDVTLSGRARVSWLFGLLTFVITYQEEVMETQVRILGFNIKKLLNKNRSKASSKKKPVKKVSKQPSAIEQEPAEEKFEPVINETEEIKKIPEEVKTPDKTAKTEDTKEKKNIFSRIASVPTKIVEICRKIKLTITNIYGKISYWKDFISDSRVRSAIALVKDQVIKIIKHILPKKIKGEVVYGFEDPCTTGQVLAGVSVIYPIYYKHMNIIPDFSGTVFKGNVDLKGRIYVFMLVKSALQIYFNKNIQFIIHTFRNKEES